MKTVLLSDVPFDAGNGAGMRAIAPYLAEIRGPLISAYRLDTGHRSEPGVDYQRVTASALFSLLRGAELLIILPDTFRLVLLAFGLRIFWPNKVRTVLWVMDDFMAGHRNGGRTRNRWAERIFGNLYRKADWVVAVSSGMARAYARNYGRAADQILGRSLEPGPKAPLRHANPDPSRLVFIGTFLEIYAEPMLALKRVLARKGLEKVRIDLYGFQPPGIEWLMPGRIEYRGTLSDADLLPKLAEYAAGLVTYSFDRHTRAIMGLSFPSKLIDYLGASLPILAIAPPEMDFLQEMRSREVGLIVNSLDEDALESAMHEILALAHTSETWSRNSARWAREEFEVDRRQVANRLMGMS